MQRFIEAQPLGVGPRVVGQAGDSGHLFRPQRRGEGHELGLRLGLGLGDDLGQLETIPRDDHRPSLDAPETVHALLVREAPEQVGQSELQRVFAETGDLQGPGIGPEAAHQIADAGLGGAEFVVVVVPGRGVFIRMTDRRVEVGVAFARRERLGGRGVGRLAQGGQSDRQTATDESHGAQEVAPPVVHRFGSDGAFGQMPRGADDHVGHGAKMTPLRRSALFF